MILGVGIASALSVRLSHPALHADEITYMSSVLESMVQETVLPVKGNGELFINKPPLAMWLMRLSFETLGPSPFAARLPSVLAAATTAAVLYLFGAALFGESAGILAALMLAFTPGPLKIHAFRSATPDALEILLMTLAIVSLELWRRRRRPWMLGCSLASVTASAWVKSPFFLAVFVVYLLATELPARRAAVGTPRFGVTLALTAGLWIGAYSGWLALITVATSPNAMAKRLLLQQYVQRIEGRYGELHGFGFYLAQIALDFGLLLLLPVAAVAAGLAAGRGSRPSRHDVACLVVWSLAAPGLATVSASKLPWYSYLSYPGIALLLAVSAWSLARAASERPSVRSALLAAVVLLLVWRLPVGRLWPATAQYRGVAGHLWELAGRDPQIQVTEGPRFRLTRQRDLAGREARLYLRMSFWRQAQRPSGESWCKAILVNRQRDAPAGEDALELFRPERRGVGLFLVDDCYGRLRAELAGL